MATTVAAKYVQYSKRLATTIIIFWMITRFLACILIVFKPQIGDLLINLLRGVDDITTINVLAYTSNSIGEKVATSYFNYKAKAVQLEQQDDNNIQNG